MAQLAPVPGPSRNRTKSAARHPGSDRQRRPVRNATSTSPTGDAGRFAVDWELPHQRDERRGRSYWSRSVGDASKGPGASAGDSSRDRPQAAKGELAIAIGRSLGTVVVTLVGSVDTLEATRLAATLHDLIDGQGNLAVAVDLSGVRRIAPSGLQVLSAAASDLQQRGGRLSLREARDGVLDALQLAGLGRFIGARFVHEAEGGPASGADGRTLTHLPNRRAAASHPAGSGRQGNSQGGSDDRA
jgi:anti-anti-sigma factor